MITFSKLLENLENNKYFEISANLKLIVISDNEGEAGYLGDSILGSIEEQVNFSIENISEISKEEYDTFFENFEYSMYKRPEEDNKEDTNEEKILKAWEAEFGDKMPKSTEKLEFYHQMRNAGFEGEEILKVLNNKLLGK